MICQDCLVQPICSHKHPYDRIIRCDLLFEYIIEELFIKTDAATLQIPRYIATGRSYQIKKYCRLVIHDGSCYNDKIPSRVLLTDSRYLNGSRQMYIYETEYTLKYKDHRNDIYNLTTNEFKRDHNERLAMSV